MGLSSNILWHQTDKKGFYGIIESRKLYYGYSVETIYARGNNAIKVAFPMVSLCDLPFAELDFFLNCDKLYPGHFKNYGGYVFGFAHSWAEKNAFSPVWYSEQYSEGLTMLVRKWNDEGRSPFLYHMLGFVKNREGQLEKAGADKYRFYNEREYRKLAPYEHIEKIGNPTLTPEEYAHYKSKNGNSLAPKSMGVDFNFSDVQYIIVPHEEDKRYVLRNYGDVIGRIPIFIKDEINTNFIGIRHHHVLDKQQSQTEQERSMTSPSKESVFNWNHVLWPQPIALRLPESPLSFNFSLPNYTPMEDFIKGQKELTKSLDAFKYLTDLFNSVSVKGFDASDNETP